MIFRGCSASLESVKKGEECKGRNKGESVTFKCYTVNKLERLNVALVLVMSES